MIRIKCKLCHRRLENDVHASTRYHLDCKRIVKRKQKRECWHRHKENYR